MMVHPCAKNILIIGGGDGDLVTEFTRWKEIENITLVEINEWLIEVSKECSHLEWDNDGTNRKSIF